MIATYQKFYADKALAKQQLDKQIGEVERKLERLEERYVLEEINKKMFAKYSKNLFPKRKN